MIVFSLKRAADSFSGKIIDVGTIAFSLQQLKCRRVGVCVYLAGLDS
jgi:hypothetical protein